MLVLSRKAEETIHIGDDVVITIVRIKGQTVKVGIDAPREVRVRRGEHIANDVQSGTGGTDEHANESDTANTSADA
jgi:carbon storage regulator CsrA